jgi:hypothetical protein
LAVRDFPASSRIHWMYLISYLQEGAVKRYFRDSFIRAGAPPHSITLSVQILHFRKICFY